MNLSTKLPLKPNRQNPIDYSSKVLLIGSCFSEHIGDKFSYFKFQSLSNPFGILFHPLAIEKFITNTINETEYDKADVFYHNEQFHCFDAHSRLSDTSEEKLIETLNQNIKSTLKFLKETSHLIITLGTAWAYRYIETDALVANCHKIPQKKFTKELLSVDSISESLEAIVSLVRQVNPEISVLFTVSPVRHLKDGFVENTRSKAHLISGIHSYLSESSGSNSSYFPSYEIMLDELRDYRFYNFDMLHPNETAINYIWERFQNVWFSEDTAQTMKEVEDVQKALAHRPVNPISVAHQTFLQDLETKQNALRDKYPLILF